MAEARRNESGGLDMTLDDREAKTLFTLLFDHVTGPDTGPRGVLDKISDAMEKAGGFPQAEDVVPFDAVVLDRRVGLLHIRGEGEPKSYVRFPSWNAGEV